MRKILFIIIWFLVASGFSQFDPRMNKLLEEKPHSFYRFLEKSLEIHTINEQKKETLEKLIVFADENNYPNAKIYAYDILAIKYRDHKERDKAVEYHKKAIALSKEINNLEAEIVSLNMLGLCYRIMSDIPNAIEYHQKVLKLASTIKGESKSHFTTIGIAMNSVGKIYMELKQYGFASEQFIGAIEIHEKINDIKGLAINYSSLGDAYTGLGKYEDAIKYYRKALEFNKTLNSKLGRILCYDRIANIYILKKEYTKAFDVLETIYYDTLILNEDRYLARIKTSLGRIQMYMDDLEASKTNLLEAYRIYKKLNIDRSRLGKLCIYLSELYDLKNDTNLAYKYYKEGVSISDETLGQQNILYIGSLIGKYDSQSKKIKIKQLETEAKQKEFESSRIRTILIIILITLALLWVILYSIYRQGLLNRDKKLLMLEQQALQAQMNPHFVFNALNSIKLYIINNEQRQAVYYLNKFSKLIRNILDTSRKKEVSLSEELETMELYITIENIRFNNEIEYEFDVDQSLHLDTIKIPPLLLQPFLENSIWHGLSSKKDNKKVTLIVEKGEEEKSVLIMIVDTGIGREAAMEIRKSKSLKRRSVGIELTEERLKTFANDYVEPSYIKYNDLKDEQGNPKGTSVVLKIPVC